MNDLIGKPIILAEEVSNIEEGSESPEYEPDSYTWTFYRLQAENGPIVTLRFYGSSNGYYSERVDFEKLNDFENLDDY